MGTCEQFSLRWNNFHSNLSSGFHDLMQGNDMVDVTLSVEGQFLKAHKIVLSICSPLFKQIFKVNPCKHPVIILRDVSAINLKDILAFMYLGEVNVLRENLGSFLRTAEMLQVKGLTGEDSRGTSPGRDYIDNEMDQDLQALSSSQEETAPSPPVVIPNNPKRTLKNSGTPVKRAKSEMQPTKWERSITPPHIIDDECDFMETPDCKAENLEYGSENEEASPSREAINQMLDYSNSNVSTPQDSNTQDTDVLLYSVDSKGHVYCPYCYRKFVNRYNLKVHIRDKHDDNPINLDCIICGKTMRNRSCLRVHLYHHRKQQVKADTSIA
ncbi:hypothetical protein FQA39_LY06334 [Lamprigera yunnana]|nr:hypothetical protein FQA39_LY06334 [Lamprigera yunnana]